MAKSWNPDLFAPTNFTGIDKFLCRRQTFRVRKKWMFKTRVYVRSCKEVGKSLFATSLDLDTTRNIAFCSLLPKKDLQLLCFHQRFLQLGFCSLIVVLMSNIKMCLKEYFSYFRRIRLKVFRRICWKHGILLKIKSATDALVIIYRNFSQQKFLRTATETYFWSLF